MVGDVVNLAARLMVAARAGILVDSETYERCKLAKNITFDHKKVDFNLNFQLEKSPQNST